jgi:hypothetical protein
MHNQQHEGVLRGTGQHGFSSGHVSEGPSPITASETAESKRVHEALGFTGPYFRVLVGALSFAPLGMWASGAALPFAMEAAPTVAFAVFGAALLAFELWLRARRIASATTKSGEHRLLRDDRVLAAFASRDARAWPPIKEVAQLVRGLLLYAIVGGVGVLLALTDLPRAGLGVVAFAAVGFVLLVRDRVALCHYYIHDRQVLLRTRDAELLFGPRSRPRHR